MSDVAVLDVDAEDGRQEQSRRWLWVIVMAAVVVGAVALLIAAAHPASASSAPSEARHLPGRSPTADNRSVGSVGGAAEPTVPSRYSADPTNPVAHRAAGPERSTRWQSAPSSDDATTLHTVGPPVTRALVPVAEALGRTTAPVAQGLAPVTSPLAQSVGPLVQPAVGALSRVAQPARGVLEPLVAPLAGSLAPVTAPLAQSLGPVIAPIGESLAPLTAPVEQALGPVTAQLAPVTAPSVGPVQERSSSPGTGAGGTPAGPPPSGPQAPAGAASRPAPSAYDAAALSTNRTGPAPGAAADGSPPLSLPPIAPVQAPAPGSDGGQSSSSGGQGLVAGFIATLGLAVSGGSRRFRPGAVIPPPSALLLAFEAPG